MEFALVLPVLIALLFTMIAAGSVLIDRLDLQSAARDAVRVASLDGADACGVAAGSLEGNDITLS
ncbi:MAG: TadE/TadG family type IV pilus assembly protein, partial [Ilumatobacter sp.]